jgi:thiamine-monophosphate kinase
MTRTQLIRALRFYFITDESPSAGDPVVQATVALEAGATMIQYRNKTTSSIHYKEASDIRKLCKINGVPFIVNDNILLARAVDADGVHLGQKDEDPTQARDILGLDAIIGISVSTIEELQRTNLSLCDYIGTGPVFATITKPDAKSIIEPAGLRIVASATDLPVVAIGGIDAEKAAICFDHGAAGIAVISYITRAKEPKENARMLAIACGCETRHPLNSPWDNEFGLITRLLQHTPSPGNNKGYINVGPGDDAALLGALTKPVITTDSQKEGVHFRLDWQSPEEIGKKAAEITLSDLAASYATPVSLFVNLSLPHDMTVETVESVYKGINSVLDNYQCTMGGGNVSASSEFSIDLFAIGQGHESIFPKRSNALPGEGLYCSGPIGLARAGLDALRRDDTGFEMLLERFRSPRARFDAAEILARNRVTCVTDISDGLIGDAGHIAKSSDLTIAFDLTAYPFEPSLLAYCEAYDLTPEHMALCGGEDYELLFTCPPETFDRIKEDLPDARQVGNCLPFGGKHLINLPPGLESFQHGNQ